MSRTTFIIILSLVSLIVGASMLPSSWYAANDRKFIGATVITCAVMLLALVLLFAAS